MPCYQVRKIAVKFNENTNLAALKDAMKEKGWRVTYENKQAGTVNFYNEKEGKSVEFNQKTGSFIHADYMQFNAEELKAPYQRQVTMHNARKAGWNVVQSKTEPNRIQLRRRR